MGARPMLLRSKLVVAAAAVALLLGAAGGALAAEEGPYPVWWSPKLELESLDRIDGRLARRFPKEQRSRLYKYAMKKVDLPGQEAENIWVTVDVQPAHDCKSFVNLTDNGYEPEYRSDLALKLHDSLWVPCYILHALRRAKPARISYLRDFVLDEHALDYLPALLGGWGCRNVFRHLRANRDGIPWSKFDFRGQQIPPIFKNLVRSENEFVLEVWPRGGRERYSETIFSIVGRGDFNGDAQDELLLLTVFHQRFGDFKTPELFLLSRANKGEVLRVIEVVGPLAWDRNLCVPTPEALTRP